MGALDPHPIALVAGATFATAGNPTHSAMCIAQDGCL